MNIAYNDSKNILISQDTPTHRHQIHNKDLSS